MQANRRNFLRLATGATLAGSSWQWLSKKSIGAQAATDSAPYMLVVHCDGGWDQTLVFDNKIGNSVVAQEAGWYLETTSGGLSYVANTTRPSVSSFFTTHGSRAAIVNGLNCHAINHAFGRKYALGAPSPTGDARYTDYLSMYAHHTARALALPHVIFEAPYTPGPYAESTVFLNERLITELTNAIPNATALGTDGEAALTTYLNSNYRDMFKYASQGSLDAQKKWNFYKGYARESHLASTLASTLAAIPVAGTDTTFSRNGKAAISLFADNHSKCATVRCGDLLQWDTHSNNFTNQTTMFESLFDGLNLILAYAQTRGIYDNLCVVVVSDLGRAPVLNANLGKDHWSYSSSLVWGPQIKTGAVVGRTDDYLRGYQISPIFGSVTGSDITLIDHSNIFAALFFKYGVLLDLTLPGVVPLAYMLEVPA